MIWRDLPSLSALRAFECAARHGSLSAAAQELNVTHAAISQHLRAMADHFGTPLMQREGQKMVLTDAGKKLAEATHTGFARIAEAAEEIRRGGEERPVSLSTTPSFAEFWLMPRLADLWRTHPDLRLSITPEARLADLRSDGHDLAIRYGRGGWPGFSQEPLVPAHLVAVMAPELEGSPPEKLTWLIEATLPEAEQWARDSGLIGTESLIRHLPNQAMILAGARSGAGAAIVPDALAVGDLLTGALIRLPQSGNIDLNYHILHRPGVLRPTVRKVLRWLRSQAVKA